jgi:hypothetical protein
VEKGYSLNIPPSNNKRRRNYMMTADAYFGSIITILTGLIFIALVLGFLYMVYGKEEAPEEEEE